MAKDLYDKLVVESNLAGAPDTLHLPVTQTSTIHASSSSQTGIPDPALITSSSAHQNEFSNPQDEDSISLLHETRPL